jgi:hypothetical protein
MRSPPAPARADGSVPWRRRLGVVLPARGLGWLLKHSPWVTRLGLPLGVSLGVHIAIAALLIASAWSFREGLAGGRALSELVISLPAPGPPPAPAKGDQLSPAAPAPAAPLVPRLTGLASPDVAPAPVLRSSTLEAPGLGDFLKRQDDGAIGATFAGMGARKAQSIVYVVDASGAMVSSLQFVLAELDRSVSSLSSSQKFQVVLFRDEGGGKVHEVFAAPGVGQRLAPATPTNKAALGRWLKSIAPGGRSNPLDGLRRGLEFQPDAIFLLSRSIRRSGGELEGASGSVWGRGREQILAELDRLNPRRGAGRRVAIKCIQFLEEDPTGTMQAIGTEHGDGPGSYSVLTLKALGR